MKIYRIAYPQELTYDEDMKDIMSAEAVRLKDGRIFYDSSINHWSIFNYLTNRGIHRDQYEAIGWLDGDGAFTAKAKGDREIEGYFKKTVW